MTRQARGSHCEGTRTRAILQLLLKYLVPAPRNPLFAYSMCDAAPRKLLFVCSAWAVHVQCSQHPVWPSARPDITATQFIVRVAEPRPSWGISHSYLAISLRGPAERCWWREDVVKSRLIRGRGRGLPRRGRWRPHHATFGLASHAVGLVLRLPASQVKSSQVKAKQVQSKQVQSRAAQCDPAQSNPHSPVGKEGRHEGGRRWIHCTCLPRQGTLESPIDHGSASRLRPGLYTCAHVLDTCGHACVHVWMRGKLPRTWRSLPN